MYKLLVEVKDLDLDMSSDDTFPTRFKTLSDAHEYLIKRVTTLFKNRYEYVHEEGEPCFNSLDEMKETVRDAIEYNDELYLIEHSTSYYWRIKRIND